METHVKVVAILHIAWGCLGVLIAVGLLLLFGGIAGIVGLAGHARDGAEVAVPVLGAIGGVIFVVVLALSLPGIVGGIGLLQFAPWARVLMLVISALDLLSVPVGTALGIYGLWTLTKPETEALFARR
jgi:hypothetical protein